MIDISEENQGIEGGPGDGSRIRTPRGQSDSTAARALALHRADQTRSSASHMSLKLSRHHSWV